MSDQPDLFGNLDTGCQCARCVGETLWPEWAQPSEDWRAIETVKVAEGRL